MRQCAQKQYRAAHFDVQKRRCVASNEVHHEQRAFNIFALVVGAVLPIALAIVALTPSSLRDAKRVVCVY